MGMNNKGQVIILRIMIAVIVLIMIMIMIEPTQQAINIGTNTSANLNCSAAPSTLSNTQTATCIVTDYLIFYLIGLAICASMAFLAGKKQVSGVITAIVVFVVTSILINPLKDLIIITRDATHLNCASTSISVASRLSCLAIDLWLFWFVLTAISATITYMFVKKVLK